jgi:DNA-binding winged helix-turn-helix (wHTH) protein
MARLGFGGFELDPTSGELWKDGECLRVPEQPLNLLLCLLEKPGQVVGREVLQQRVWAGDTHVGYEDGLNSAAWRLRQVLGDTAEKHVFVETIPKKGYRFVGKVVYLPGKPSPIPESCPMPVVRPDSGLSRRLAESADQTNRRWNLWLGGALTLGLTVAGAGLWAAFQPRPITVGIAPLQNETGDPALDYFAAALTWQVRQDLNESRGLKEQSLPEHLPPGRDGRTPSETATLKLDWALARVDKGYQITVKLTGPQGQVLGDAVFRATSDDLHDVHRKISAFVTTRAAQPFRYTG